VHGPREVLNELKWRADRDLATVEVWYVHRGVANDTRIVRGSDVVALHASFMEVRAPRERGMGGTAMIPYHRVFRIVEAGEPLWERRSRSPPQGGDDEADERDDEGREAGGR